MSTPTLEEKLFELAKAYWNLQESNYDIVWNHKDLLDFDFAGPALEEKLDQVTARCNEIKSSENPPPSPKVDTIFRDSIAPVPNNTVINAVARAIMAGGDDYYQKIPCWEEKGNEFSYEVEHENAGTITVTIADCQDQASFIQSLSLFTLDVLVGMVGHLCSAYCDNKPENVLSLKTIVTARQLLKYKRVKTYGAKRWVMIRNIHEEMKKLNNFLVTVRNATSKDGPRGYEGHLAIIQTVKRDYDRYTKTYVPSCWEVKPGIWAEYNMSMRNYAFIGKLNRALLEYDHRGQRSAQPFAKKLMYALFVIPGGTYYVNNGVKKSLRQYLELIGEFRADGDTHRYNPRRTIERLADAIDFLVDQSMIVG